MPEVFVKALNLARNLGHPVRDRDHARTRRQMAAIVPAVIALRAGVTIHE